MANVPLVDTEPTAAADDTSKVEVNEGHAYRQLEAEITAIENINRETDQRYNLRFWSVIVTSLLALLFIMVLLHLLHNLPQVLDSQPAFPIILALYVAPIFATTTLSVSLMIAAFRGYKDQDRDGISSAAANGARISSVGL